MQDKCTKPCVGCQCHKGKDPKVKKHQEHVDFEKKSEVNNSWVSVMPVSYTHLISIQIINCISIVKYRI